MIDIHCHILPGVDDGAPDLQTSVAMLAMAREDGTTAMVATPHSNTQYEFDPDRCRSGLHQLAAVCPAGPALYLGCEVHLTAENLDSVLARPDLYSINGKGYVLLELPNPANPQAVALTVQRLTDTGVRSVIAHPERIHIFKDAKYAERLAQMGAYFQVTAHAVVGSTGADVDRACRGLFKQRLVHFVASDAHGVEHRRPLLSAAFEQVAREYGQANAELLFIHNPAACIAGQPVVAAKPKRSFFSFGAGRSKLARQMA